MTGVSLTTDELAASAGLDGDTSASSSPLRPRRRPPVGLGRSTTTRPASSPGWPPASSARASSRATCGCTGCPPTARPASSSSWSARWSPAQPGGPPPGARAAGRAVPLGDQLRASLLRPLSAGPARSQLTAPTSSRTRRTSGPRTSAWAGQISAVAPRGRPARRRPEGQRAVPGRPGAPDRRSPSRSTSSPSRPTAESGRVRLDQGPRHRHRRPRRHPGRGRRRHRADARLPAGRTAGPGPASLEVCTLFDKPARRIVPRPCAYVGFEIGDEFVVGYGLDFRGRYRNLDLVAAGDLDDAGGRSRMPTLTSCIPS